MYFYVYTFMYMYILLVHLFILVQHTFTESSIVYAEKFKKETYWGNNTTFLKYPGTLILQSWGDKFQKIPSFSSDFTSCFPWIDTARGIPFCNPRPDASANQLIAH